MIKRGVTMKDGTKYGYYKSDQNNKLYLYDIGNKESLSQAKYQAEINDKTNDNIEINNCNFKIIEICEDKDSTIVGRKKITLAFHEIHNDATKWNENGLSFKSQYVEDNMSTAVNMPLVVSYVDDDRDAISGHGTRVIDEDTGETYFEDSEILGSITEVFITEIEVDGNKVSVLAGSGYIYSQRHHNLVKYLDEIKDDETISGSVEIAVTEYENGWKAQGRVPKIYCYTGHALVINPADKNAIVMELNENENEKEEGGELKNEVLIKKYAVEINEKSFDDIGYLVCKAFNDAMKPDDYRSDWYYDEFYIHKPYATKMIMKKYGEYGKYWMVYYTIDGYKVTLTDITLAEMEWIPVKEEVEIKVEVSSLKDVDKSIDNKVDEVNDKKNETSKNNEDNQEEDQMTVEELNSTIATKDTKISELQATVETNATLLTEKDLKITQLETEVSEVKGKLQVAENEKLVSEVNSKVEGYATETKDFYKEKIETFTAQPTLEAKDSLIGEMDKFNSTILSLKTTTSETNDKKEKASDIYSEINELDDEPKSDDSIWG